MDINKKTIRDVEVTDKKVLVRVDFNVPIKDGIIQDDNRIIQALPTIKYLIDNNAKIILCSHLGKVKTEEDKATKSLAPVAKRLAELLNQDVVFIDQTRGEKLETAIDNLNPGEVLMFENTRFEDVDGKKESGCDQELADYWASLVDMVVIDAFGTAHRAHASNVGISNASDIAVSGFLIEKEIDFLNNALTNPNHPFVAIVGGAKVSDKIAVIKQLLTKADYVLIGGGMAYTFLKAQGYNIGDSICELDKLDVANEILSLGKDKIILPIDVKLNNQFANDGDIKVVSYDQIPDGYQGLDIGDQTIELFAKYIKNAKTIVWNGPMGVFEFSNFAKGTNSVCEAIKDNPEAISIIGGGDSAAAAISLGYQDQFSHISTGGGASLEFLEGKDLPGISCLDNK